VGQKDIIQIIKQDRLLPLFYHDDSSICIRVVRALYDGGVRCVEFTNRGKNALANFSELVKERNASMPGLLLAIGTIKTEKEAEAFISEGADFLISPVFDTSVASFINANDILWIPGCMSPTEIHTAQQAGCQLVKLFPGNVLGKGFVEAIQPLFSGIDYIVTGGVEANKENIMGWLNAGAAAVGLGSKLITKEVLVNNKLEELTADTRKLLAEIR
jgi:2-dehydro-3-deoxyphosphogluconate aldolase / (4S)-4-hydroxy-2-oxoglutarate aldolase